jgi:Mn-dependent DtxR family transcriptional regulator
MTLNHDVYSFSLLKDGANLDEIARNSSMSYIENLKVNNLIWIEEGKVFLTEKGEAAKKVGVEKYLKLEKYEAKVSAWNKEKRQRDIRFVKLASLLVLILTALLFYINFLLI